MKNINLFLFFLYFISCTRDFGIKITRPTAEVFLSKMQNGKWSGASVNGNNLVISGGGELNGNYKFESPILGIGGIYKDDNGGFILATPGPDGLIVIGVDQSGKDALDTIVSLVDEEGGEKVLVNLVSQVVNSGGNMDLSDSDKILSGMNLSLEKRAEIEAVLKDSQGSFKNGQTIK